MSSIKRIGGESYQAMSNFRNIIEEWALKDADKIKRSCNSCVYAVKDGPFKCSAYNTVPPLSVIMNGCSSYSDNDDIPF